MTFAGPRPESLAVARRPVSASPSAGYTLTIVAADWSRGGQVHYLGVVHRSQVWPGSQGREIEASQTV